MENKLLVFGASGNLGKGVTETFLKQEYDKVFLFAKNLNSLDVEQKKVEYIKIQNLAEEENVRQAFSYVIANKETNYFLFSTIGGYTGGKRIMETDYQVWLKMQQINLNISFLLAKYFALLVKQSAGGSICFTSAMTGIQSEEKKGAYGVSKAGLNYLVKTLALEGKSINMTANAVAPYALDTPENREWIEGENKLVHPQELAQFVHSIFINFKAVSGNIFELPERTIKYP